MKKLLPLILLVSCADPNAELLAKYKNLEIENNYLNTKLKSTRDNFEKLNVLISNDLYICRNDLKEFVCAKKNKDSLDWRVLCEEPTLLALPESEAE